MYPFRRCETNVMIHHDHVREHSELHQGTDSADKSEQDINQSSPNEEKKSAKELEK